MPAVSVVVPNFNHAPFLARRLDSVLGQTLRDIEVIVLDDASTDASMEIIGRWTQDPRIRVMRNDVNSGSPFVQWNRGVAATTAPLVWIAESDDDADPRLLETLVDRLDRHPRCGLAFAQSLCVDEQGRVSGTQTQWTDSVDRTHWLADYVNDGRAECAQLLAITNTIPNASAVVFRRVAYEQVGGAPETMRLSGDWMTWLRMLLVSDVAFVAEPLNRHRSHDATVRLAFAGDPRWWRETLEILEIRRCATGPARGHLHPHRRHPARGDGAPAAAGRHAPQAARRPPHLRPPSRPESLALSGAPDRDACVRQPDRPRGTIASTGVTCALAYCRLTTGPRVDLHRMGRGQESCHGRASQFESVDERLEDGAQHPALVVAQVAECLRIVGVSQRREYGHQPSSGRTQCNDLVDVVLVLG